MKKLFLIFAFIAVFAFAEEAARGASDKITDPVTGWTMCCLKTKSACFGVNVAQIVVAALTIGAVPIGGVATAIAVASGVTSNSSKPYTLNFNAGGLAFGDFPRIRKCIDKKHSANDYWDEGYNLICPGLSLDKYDETRMTPVAKCGGYTAGKSVPNCAAAKEKCWAWECKSGYLLFNAACVTSNECLTAGNTISGDQKKCIATKWCAGVNASAFNIEIHDSVVVSDGAPCDTILCGVFGKSSDCSEIRCTPGNCINDPLTLGCQALSPTGTLGGIAIGSKGRCQPCGEKQFVASDGNGCDPGVRVSQDEMRKCMNEIDPGNFADCIRNNKTP